MVSIQSETWIGMIDGRSVQNPLTHLYNIAR